MKQKTLHGAKANKKKHTHRKPEQRTQKKNKKTQRQYKTHQHPTIFTNFCRVVDRAATASCISWRSTMLLQPKRVAPIWQLTRAVCALIIRLPHARTHPRRASTRAAVRCDAVIIVNVIGMSTGAQIVRDTAVDRVIVVRVRIRPGAVSSAHIRKKLWSILFFMHND